MESSLNDEKKERKTKRIRLGSDLSDLVRCYDTDPSITGLYLDLGILVKTAFFDKKDLLLLISVVYKKDTT